MFPEIIAIEYEYWLDQVYRLYISKEIDVFEFDTREIVKLNLVVFIDRSVRFITFE